MRSNGCYYISFYYYYMERGLDMGREEEEYEKEKYKG